MKRWLVPMLAILLPPLGAMAQDTLSAMPSPRQEVRAELDWAVPISALRGRTKSAHDLDGLVARVPQLDLRLDTRRWQGRNVRVYMRMPSAIQGLTGTSGLRMTWRGDGRFEDGVLVPGDRALIYAGPVDGPELRGILNVQFELDAGSVSGLIRFDPEFEIETAGANRK